LEAINKPTLILQSGGGILSLNAKLDSDKELVEIAITGRIGGLSIVMKARKAEARNICCEQCYDLTEDQSDQMKQRWIVGLPVLFKRTVKEVRDILRNIFDIEVPELNEPSPTFEKLQGTLENRGMVRYVSGRK
jgi:hypothetical protein